MTPALRAAALAELRQELPESADPADLEPALAAALELMKHPRDTWPTTPADPWEQLVLGVAFALLRLEGTRPRAFALAALKEVLAELAGGPPDAPRAA